MRYAASLLLLGWLAATAVAGQPPRVVQVPGEGRVPDVAAAGAVVHLVYGAGGDGFYCRSEDGGRTFAAPLRLNRQDGDCVAQGERGPKVALGGDGTVHVLWPRPRLEGVRYARLRPGATAFEAERELLPEGAGAAEGSAIAVHDDAVLVVWLDGASGAPPNSPVGLPLFGRLSRDGGESFSPAGPLAHDYGGGACACCNLAAGVDPEGRFVIAFRGAREAVRDLFLLRGDAPTKRFKTVRLSKEEWRLEACPMDGPRLGGAGKELLVAWTVEGRVGVTRVRGSKASEALHPLQRGQARQALVLPAPGGRVLLAWVDREGQLCWELGGEGEPERGQAGPVPAGSRPAGFVDQDGLPVLVR